MIKSIKIEQEGFLDFRQVQVGMYSEIRADFRARFGINLPPYHELYKFGETRDLRILLNPLIVTLDFTGGPWIQYGFKRGFITDLASVPSFFRSVVDNDDSRLLPAALIHDVNFSMHFPWMPFKSTNKLFRAMARKGGYPAFKSWLAYVAVNSFAGRKRWRETTPMREPWTAQTVDVATSWPEKAPYIFIP